jgi:hypothetical protein
MARELLISALLSEVRIAVLEEGRLFELWVDEPERERLVGNIYVGRVKKIVQGLNAAFLDIGLPQDAFLHFSDVVESLEGLDTAEEDAGSKAADAKVAAPPRPVRATKANGRNREYPTFWTRRSGRVTIPLEPQQRLIVQVMRDAYAEKGVRVTTHVTIPGHYFVLAPFDTGIGVSHKIGDEEERRRLRRLVRQLLPAEYGCIVRTAAQGQDTETLQRELRWLLQEWNQIEQQARKARPPQLLRREPPLYIEAVREFLAPELQRILVDSRPIYRRFASTCSALYRRSCTSWSCTPTRSRSSTASASKPRSNGSTSAGCRCPEVARSSLTTPKPWWSSMSTPGGACTMPARSSMRCGPIWKLRARSPARCGCAISAESSLWTSLTYSRSAIASRSTRSSSASLPATAPRPSSTP